ncbi:MAG TPA: GNAT family N-acetyltransferase [Chthoniobacterales bacterium]|nr:GNAT family N-acetyltransferase [Chthoniobacterales bacterium]
MTQPVPTFPIANGEIQLVSGRDLANYPEWKHVFADSYKDHRYYEIIEATLDCDFEHHYLVLRAANGKVRAMQPLFVVRQNLVEGLRGAIRTLIERIRRKFPRFLTMRILMVGCAAGEGHLGAASAEDKLMLSKALHSSLQEIARHTRTSLVVLKDFPSQYRTPLQTFSQNGYTRIPSMPLTRLELKYADFDQYLATLGKATRKNLRRKFRDAERAGKIDLDIVNDVTPYVNEIYPLYRQVHERSRLKFETLTPDYFRRLSREMSDRTRFFIWRRHGKIIAFSLCFVHGDTIYDEYLGMDYDVALDLHLYFYTLRDIISWAMSQRLRYYSSTPLNYDPKLHLKCDLVPLDLYVRHTTALVNPIFRLAARFLEPTRHDPVLRKFPNAQAMLS